ncbi:unknown [Porphyromonas sp. CAG:1061]|nr:unknown [Porphyromonas sp. CAG:1061]
MDSPYKVNTGSAPTMLSSQSNIFKIIRISKDLLTRIWHWNICTMLLLLETIALKAGIMRQSIAETN